MQKIIQIGNSIGIVLPQDVRTYLSADKGDAISFEKKAGKAVLLTVKKERKYKNGVTPAFAAMVDTFMQEHEDVLKKLSEK